ncbi:CLUMA_CG004755, isoform A [Clunio marinus]|uniref:CLUMA_CG004755, isoform A n=1 Tax=Clunio marinus TaxID=568069 RepID=A0A1J1HSU6_9DIPT|nr:CLUMA_CG004755, isoform A [Clunio marinus]
MKAILVAGTINDHGYLLPTVPFLLDSLDINSQSDETNDSNSSGEIFKRAVTIEDSEAQIHHLEENIAMLEDFIKLKR